jgi:aminopeptidase S
MRATFLLVVAIATLLAGCTAQPPASPVTAQRRPIVVVSPRTQQRAPAFDLARAIEDIRMLAALGPREATSRTYRVAATRVAQRFRNLEYTVREQTVQVPAGVSWGVPVGKGTTVNVIALPLRFNPTRPYMIVAGHLDTVPQSPGGNDNATGVAIVLELARLASIRPPLTPVVFIAFGAEEPRGPGDDGHHFGSREYVRRMDELARNTLAGVVAIDRVGAGGRVLVCNGGLSPRTLVRELLAVAAQAGIPASSCRNRTSDHWPFERFGFVTARLDGGRFPGYHSARDIAEAVSAVQVGRAGRMVWRMLRSYRA